MSTPDAQEGGPLLDATLALFRVLCRYHRFEVEGIDLLTRGEPGLLVGYHGRPWALDYFCLVAWMDARGLPFPRAVVADLGFHLPVVRDLYREAGHVGGDPGADAIAALRVRGRHLYVAPGGLREALRPFWRDRYRLAWGERRGYVELAHRYGLPMYLLAASGVDLCYLGLNDGYRTSKTLFSHGGVPAWLGLGLGGVWPLALPLPVKIHARIEGPIHLAELRDAHAAADDDAFYRAADAHIRSRLQQALWKMNGMSATEASS
jgi:hypothetical protein